MERSSVGGWPERVCPAKQACILAGQTDLTSRGRPMGLAQQKPPARDRERAAADPKTELQDLCWASEEHVCLGVVSP